VVDNFPSPAPPSAATRACPALACVKQAAAQANPELGTLGATKAERIIDACEQLHAGRYTDQFGVDMIKGGAGAPI
jgi:aspartate ammonia-lyase